MGANDGHESSGGHPLDDFRFSIQADEDGSSVVSVHHVGADDAVVGNTTPSSRGAAGHRQAMAQLNQGTPEDMDAYRALQNGDPDFPVVLAQMQELAGSGHVPAEDVQDISYNPRRFIHEYMNLKDRLVAQVQGAPRVDGIIEVEDALKEQRRSSGGVQSRDLEHRLASRYLGGR